MTRRFLVIGRSARTDGDFSLKDIPGTSGRIDVLVRCVTTGLLLSNGIRRDTIVYVLLMGPPGPPKLLRFDGATIKHLNPDERSGASLIQAASRLPVAPGGWLEASPGIAVAVADREVAGREFAGLDAVLLAESGDQKVSFSDSSFLFILGGHSDPDEADLEQIGVKNPGTMSVGPLSLHADHCITILHHRMDSAVGQKGGSAALKILGG